MNVRALPTCKKPVGEGAKRTRSAPGDKSSFLREVAESGMKLTCSGRAKKRVKPPKTRISARIPFSGKTKRFHHRGHGGHRENSNLQNRLFPLQKLVWWIESD